jgi:regulator of ribonuclease activity A
MIDFATCDLCDPFRDDPTALRVLPPEWHDYGGLPRFAGPVATVQCVEDNLIVKALLDSPGQGRVLVVDGGGSLRTALVGGNLAAAAARNGWAGIVVDGAVRDVAELRATAVGVRALATCPMPPAKRGTGSQGVPVGLRGVVVRPGDWLYADADGIVVSHQPLHGG